MSIVDTIDETLVRTLRIEIAEELSAKVRTLAAEGRHLDTADEEMLTRQLIGHRLERLASMAIAEGRHVMTQDEEDELARSVFDRLFHLGRLQSLLDDRDRAREMGEAGARHVREHFTSAQAAVQLRELARLVART